MCGYGRSEFGMGDRACGVGTLLGAPDPEQRDRAATALRVPVSVDRFCDRRDMLLRDGNRQLLFSWVVPGSPPMRAAYRLRFIHSPGHEVCSEGEGSPGIWASGEGLRLRCVGGRLLIGFAGQGMMGRSPSGRGHFRPADCDNGLKQAVARPDVGRTYPETRIRGHETAFGQVFDGGSGIGSNVVAFGADHPARLLSVSNLPECASDRIVNVACRMGGRRRSRRNAWPQCRCARCAERGCPGIVTCPHR